MQFLNRPPVNPLKLGFLQIQRIFLSNATAVVRPLLLNSCNYSWYFSIQMKEIFFLKPIFIIQRYGHVSGHFLGGLDISMIFTRQWTPCKATFCYFPSRSGINPGLCCSPTRGTGRTCSLADLQLVCLLCSPTLNCLLYTRAPGFLFNFFIHHKSKICLGLWSDKIIIHNWAKTGDGEVTNKAPLLVKWIWFQSLG